MADHETGQILWFSPDPRAIIDLDAFHVPRTLRPLIRRGKFRVTINRCFERVIRACADRKPTWISPEIVEIYAELHHTGFAHSVEAWREGELAGGLYGVGVGAAFFGESMFHYATAASKVALVALVQHLRERRFLLLDTQYLTEHLARFGAYTIPRQRYLKLLAEALSTPREFTSPSQTEIVITL